MSFSVKNDHLSISTRMSEEKVKIVLLGPSLVGKTSIITAYTADLFETQTKSTVGASFVGKVLNLGQNRRLRLHIWDTAGQEKFRSLAPMYYRNADVAIIVYSVADRNSFLEVESWVEQLKSETETDPLIYIVGNKIDLPKDRIEVHPEEGQQQALVCGGSFIETSAKSGTNLEELFWMIGNDVWAAKEKEQSNEELHKKTAERNPRTGCC